MSIGSDGSVLPRYADPASTNGGSYSSQLDRRDHGPLLGRINKNRQSAESQKSCKSTLIECEISSQIVEKAGW